MIEENDLQSIEVSSGFGANTRVPFVQLVIHAADWTTQMAPETARELAHSLLAAADAAESDGFLVGYFKDAVGIENEQVIVAALYAFREYREERRKEWSLHAGN